VELPPPHLYRAEALSRERDAKTVARALEIRAGLLARGAHPVFTLNHLAQLTGASWTYLRTVVSRTRDPYLSIKRRKRNGKARGISSPEPVLMDAQRWILGNILAACEVHPASYAYRRRRSILDCAALHLDARWLIKMDIHDFFGRIRERAVYPIFLGLGYPRLLSFEMTRLCTRARPFDWIRDDREAEHSTPYRLAGEGRLPQGAPTSGLLANAVMLATDKRLQKLAHEEGLVYTRYSDDLIFSAGAEFSRERAAKLIPRIGGILEAEGFPPHRAKTRVVPPGARHVVLGLLLADGRVRLLPEFKRRLEVHIRGVGKFGLAGHAEWRNFDSVFGMINHVDGLISFAESVEPEFAAQSRNSWEAALAEAGYPQAG
jgi:RNA-directed DNA polymerase